MVREEAIELDTSIPGPSPSSSASMAAVVPEQEELPAVSSSASMAAVRHHSAAVSAQMDAVDPPAAAPSGSSFLSTLAVSSRARWVVGLVFGFLIGFVLAHQVARLQEHGKYEPLRKELLSEYQAADSLEKWSSLEETRSAITRELDARQGRIAITAFAVWGLVCALILMAWLRFIDWKRWLPEGATAS
jgi:hypothetical protein